MSRSYFSLLQMEKEKQDRAVGKAFFSISEHGKTERESSPPPVSNEKKFEKQEPVSNSIRTSSTETRNPTSRSVFLVELANHMKSALDTIRGFAELSQGRFKDPEFEYNFMRVVTGEVNRVDSELDCFLDFLKIKSPVRRANTVHTLFEEVLEANEKRLREKKIRIAQKQYEQDLPETSVRDDHLRYILNWVLQYAILSMPPNGQIGFCTRSFDGQDTKDTLKTFLCKERKHIEILFLFTVDEKAEDPLDKEKTVKSGARPHGKNLMLPLVEDIVRLNRGLIESAFDRDKHLLQISLILPVERRRDLR